MNTDAITLQIPPDKQFHGVARLVVGGLAARLDLSYEHLEDLQLALATVLDNGYSTGSNVTVKLAVNPGSVAMAIGPLARGSSARRPRKTGRRDLASPAPFHARRTSSSTSR